MSGGYESPRRELPDALGQSEAFLEFQSRLSQVAKVERPVLLVGERGTGKELAAARLHYLSNRWDCDLVALNCAALAPSVLESELFGHEAGSFTGATKRRQGRFEAADGGTLFLDEIGLVPIEVQEKILRVVEYGMFERVGSSEAIEVDARIIGATNADLPALAHAGKFKQDLLDRLSFEVLFLPPLRERKEDVLLLAAHFAARMARELGMEEVPEFSTGAARALESYDWPGNIRELKNVVERAVYRSQKPKIGEIDFEPFRNPYSERLERPRDPNPEASGNGVGFRLGEDSLPDAVKRLEVFALTQALQQSQFKQAEAAEKLGLSYHQFRGLYRKYRQELEALG